MNTSTRIAAATLTLLGILATTTPAQAGSLRHIDEQATRLERQATNLYRFLDARDGHGIAVRRLSRRARNIARKANHIHEMIHDSHNRSHRSLMRHIRHDTEELDRLLHEAKAVLAEMHRDVPIRHVRRSPHVDVAIGHGWQIHFGGRGVQINQGRRHHVDRRHVDHGRRNMLRRVESMLAAMQRSLHHLQDDLRS